MKLELKKHPLIFLVWLVVLGGVGYFLHKGTIKWPEAAAFVTVLGLPSLLGAKKGGAAVLALAIGVSVTACPPASSPRPDPEVTETVTKVGKAAEGVCSLIEGIESSGALRTVCATVEEIVSAVQFIMTLRLAQADAGDPRARPMGCKDLPHTDFCATSDERARAILVIVRTRSARLMLDGGR